MPGTTYGSDILMAVWDGKTETVRKLLKEGADVNVAVPVGKAARVTPLMFAVLKGNFKIVKELVSYGADVNARDKWGYTALRFAREMDYTGIIDMLREAGATN